MFQFKSKGKKKPQQNKQANTKQPMASLKAGRQEEFHLLLGRFSLLFYLCLQRIG